MSIQHTVVFRLIHAQGSELEQDFLDTAHRELTAIAEVQDFAINRQVSAKSDLHWQFTMTFASQAEYDTYNAHPAHTAFVESRWIPEVAAFQEYDFSAR